MLLVNHVGFPDFVTNFLLESSIIWRAENRSWITWNQVLEIAWIAQRYNKKRAYIPTNRNSDMIDLQQFLKHILTLELWK